MTPDIRPLVAGNWKMNGTRENLAELKAIADGLGPDLTARIDARGQRHHPRQGAGRQGRGSGPHHLHRRDRGRA